MTFKKNTKQRKIILDIIESSSSPLTAEQILKFANEKYPNIAKTTIYRNIDLLLQDNEIARFRLDDNSYSYMSNKKHEHFIRCKKCGKISPIEDCPIEELEDKISKETGFEITNHSIELSGYCNNCKNKNPEKK